MNTQAVTAWQLTGPGLDTLRQTRVEVAAPGPGEILVAVGAVALNHRDLLVAEGAFLPDLPRPFTPASDAAGRVVAVGSGVQRFGVGDRVLTHFWVDWHAGRPPVPELAQGRARGGPLPGVLAERILLDEQHAVRAPASLSDREAATLPIAGLTAYSAVLADGALGPADIVLVQGTGGVACFAIQFAAVLGCRVLVTSSSTEKLEAARQLGATDIVHRGGTPDWAHAVRALTDGRGADRIIEVAGGEALRHSLAALRFGGEIVQIGFLQGIEARFDLPALMLRQARLRGVAVGHRSAFEDLTAWIERHRLAPRIDSAFAFERADRAFQRLREGPLGKVVVTL